MQRALWSGENMNFKVIVAIIVVIVLVIAGSAAYVLLSHKPAVVPSTIVVDASTQPGTVDPAAAGSTSSWGAVQQIYQTLVAYNGSSDTSFVGQLAYKWSHGPTYMNWTFYLRHNVTFSNGDPFNAYVMWYSLYRGMVMNLTMSYVLWESFNDTTIGPAFLNSANFSSPSASQLAVMENTSLPIYVINQYEIHFAQGSGYFGDVPYAHFLATLTVPVCAAVDPIYIDAHGGVVADQKNGYLSDNAMGTGPYELKTWVKGSYMEFVKSPDYWGLQLPSSQLNNAIDPARSNVTVDYVGVATTAIANIKSGKAQIIDAEYSPTVINSLKSTPGITVTEMPPIYGSTQASWFMYMNTSYEYFSNLSVRAAIVHALNYSEIISLAFGGYAYPWVGPVVPGYPDYNPNNLSPYQYNLTLAKSEMKAAGHPNGLPGTFNFLYVSSTDITSAADIIKSDLSAIGINITLEGVSLSSFDSITFPPTANVSAYPLGLDFYSADYVSPDDATQQIVLPGGTAWPPSNWTNTTIDNEAYSAMSNVSASAVSQMYANITAAMYNQYIDAWLAVPAVFAIYSSNLHGMVFNAMGSVAPNFVMYFNTLYLT